MSLLSRPDPGWPLRARAEIGRWRRACGQGLVAMHHIGSTAVPGLPAKPVIDLLAVFDDAAALDQAEPAARALGYDWLGEHGIPARRYARRIDPATGERLFHMHGFALGAPQIDRHLAVRDRLRADAGLRQRYAALKLRCARSHGTDRSAYSDCKAPFLASLTESPRT